MTALVVAFHAWRINHAADKHMWGWPELLHHINQQTRTGR